MKGRVAEFTRWLHARPEQFIIAFGHSIFWKHFANQRTCLKNCEYVAMWW
jgi:hypothetical protein